MSCHFVALSLLIFAATKVMDMKENYIRRSFPEAVSDKVTPEAGKPIRYGDRLFVRLTMMGRVVLELMVTKVCDFSELLAEVRRQVRHLRGLATLSVRNMLRGWSDVRPIMLYKPKMSVPSASQTAAPDGTFDFEPQPARMLCPWETH